MVLQDVTYVIRSKVRKIAILGVAIALGGCSVLDVDTKKTVVDDKSINARVDQLEARLDRIEDKIDALLATQES